LDGFLRPVFLAARGEMELPYVLGPKPFAQAVSSA
jgi:hypothetical protein